MGTTGTTDTIKSSYCLFPRVFKAKLLYTYDKYKERRKNKNNE